MGLFSLPLSALGCGYGFPLRAARARGLAGQARRTRIRLSNRARRFRRGGRRLVARSSRLGGGPSVGHLLHGRRARRHHPRQVPHPRGGQRGRFDARLRHFLPQHRKHGAAYARSAACLRRGVSHRLGSARKVSRTPQNDLVHLVQSAQPHRAGLDGKRPDVYRQFVPKVRRAGAFRRDTLRPYAARRQLRALRRDALRQRGGRVRVRQQGFQLGGASRRRRRRGGRRLAARGGARPERQRSGRAQRFGGGRHRGGVPLRRSVVGRIARLPLRQSPLGRGLFRRAFAFGQSRSPTGHLSYVDRYVRLSCGRRANVRLRQTRVRRVGDGGRAVPRQRRRVRARQYRLPAQYAIRGDPPFRRGRAGVFCNG